MMDRRYPLNSIRGHDLADHCYNGDTIIASDGEAITFGQAVYIKASDGKLYKADATTNYGTVGLWVAPGTVLVRGIIRDDSWAFTVGASVYLSTTAGDLSSSSPTGGNLSVRVGLAVTATILDAVFPVMFVRDTPVSGGYGPISANWAYDYSQVTTFVRAEPTATQYIPTGTAYPVLLDNELTDLGSEFDASVKTGIARATTANHLIDTTANPFVAADVGKWVWNTTDNTYATITVYNSTSDVTISADIMTNGEGYKVYHSRFLVATTGYYMIAGGIRYPSGTVVADKSYFCIIMKNGTVQSSLGSNHASFAGTVVTGTCLPLYLVAGDYIQLFAYHAAGTTQEISTGVLTQTHLDISRIK